MIMLNKLKKLIYFFIMLLLFLYSFLPYEAYTSTFALILRLTSLLTFTISFILYSKFNLKKNIKSIFILFIIIVYSGLSVLISFNLHFFIFLISILSTYILANLIINNKSAYNLFIKIIEWVMILSIFTLFFQILIYIILKNIVYIHNMIFPISHARVQIIDKLNVFRFGGMYIEPGSYANWMYTFTLIYIILKHKLKLLLIIMSALSIILTMSVWGMIFGSYLLLIFLIMSLNTFIKRKVIIFIFFVFIFFILLNNNLVLIHELLENNPLIEYVKVKLEMKSESGISKILTINEFKQNFFSLLFLGEGYDPKIYRNILSPQDAGIFINFSIIFGVLFSFILFLLLFLNSLKLKNKSILFLFLPLLFNKMFYWEPTFWLLFFLVVFKFKNKLKDI